MAEELCQDEGIKTAHVRFMMTALPHQKRGNTAEEELLEMFFVIKIAGAAVDAGRSLMKWFG